MKNNELGFESLYMHGMGGASIDDHPRSISVEAYDGFEDAASIELAHAMESLDFMGTYEAINSKITADKIRMCKRLAVNYGKNSSLLNKQAANSIESLCLQYSLEAENNAVASSTGTKTDKKPGTDKTAKKEGFFKRMVKILKTVFEKIVTFFKTIFGTVSKFIRDLFKKAPAKDVDVKDIKEAVAARSNGPSEEFLGSKYFIIGGSLNFDAASNPIVIQTEALVKMMSDENELKKMGDKGGELNTMIYKGGSKDTAKFQAVANKVKAQTAAIMKAFGVNDGSVIDVAGREQYEKISIQKAFGVKIAKASDKAGMEAAMKWAASGDNVNKAGDSLNKVIEGAAKKISNCAGKCIKYANELDKRYDAATGDAEVIGKTMVSGLRDVAKIQQSYGKLLSRLSKMVAASYKLNDCGDPEKRKRKAAAANYKSPNEDKSKTIGVKMNNADRYAGEQIAKNHQQKQ